MRTEVIQAKLGSSDLEAVPGVSKNLTIAFADPPYNIGIQYADDPTRDRLEQNQYEQFCTMSMFVMYQHLRPGGTLWWLCPSAHQDFIPRLLNKWGKPLYRIIKMETFAQYQQETLTDDYRMLYVFQKPGGPLTFNPDSIRTPSKRQLIYRDKRADPRGRVPGQVWEIRRLQGTAVDRVDWHKAQLPPELLHRIVAGWSNPGDDVADFFAGSGNMGRTCMGLGRNSYLVDQSPTYVQKIKERLGLCLPPQQ
jgi:DNA modification methylase